MTTAGNMLNELRSLLRTWSTQEEQSTTLNGDLAADGLSFMVSDTRDVVLGITPGLTEIDSELMYVSNVDANGTVTIAPWGRGYRDTVAAAHADKSRVISQPLYPRQKMLDQLNVALNRIFPTLYAIKHFNASTTQPIITYNLPDDAQRVLMVEWQPPSSRHLWESVKYFRDNPGGRPTSADGNNPQQGFTCDVGEYMMPGRPIHFIYAAKPSPLVNESDVFETVTGLPASAKDVVLYAAASAMVIPNETSRLQPGSIEQQDRATKIAPGAALQASRYLEQEYQTRLMEERKALLQLYPPRLTGPWP